MANLLPDRATRAKLSNKLMSTAKSQLVKKCCPMGQFLLLIYVACNCMQKKRFCFSERFEKRRNMNPVIGLQTGKMYVTARKWL